jgi:lipoprotein-releasing system permease protein
MFKPLPCFIGLRYTGAKRRNHFISFISGTSILGLVLGVAVLIIVLSVMNGFDRELRQRVLGMVPHATINGYDPIKNWQDVGKEASKNPHVIGVAPFIQAQGMLANAGRVRGAMINGILPEEELKVSIVGDHMVAGKLSDLKADDFGIVLGDLLARALGASVGAKVTIVLPEASVTLGGVFPRLKRFTVVGIFKVGAELDSSLAYIHLTDAQKLVKYNDDEVEGVRLKLDDLFLASRVASDISYKLSANYFPRDWTYTHGNLFQAIKMEKHMIALLLLLIIFVAAFNIVSTLVMVVTDKEADIAILRTLGASPRMIMAIFIVQGGIIGVGGTILGTLLGIFVALNISQWVHAFEHFFGVQILDANVYFISYLPSELRMEDIILVVSAGLILSFCATIYPAWRASKTEPAEALRYE